MYSQIRYLKKPPGGYLLKPHDPAKLLLILHISNPDSMRIVFDGLRHIDRGKHMTEVRNRAQATPAQSMDNSDATAEMMEKYGKDPMMILAGPLDHDRARRQAMRHFGPPHSPDLIPGMEPECQRIVNDLLDKARGKTRIDVVDEYAYPLPVNVICQILGVPLQDAPLFHAWIADLMAATGLGPEAATGEGQRRREKGTASSRRAWVSPQGQIWAS